jgi:hypothetical protein
MTGGVEGLLWGFVMGRSDWKKHVQPDGSGQMTGADSEAFGLRSLIWR